MFIFEFKTIYSISKLINDSNFVCYMLVLHSDFVSYFFYTVGNKYSRIPAVDSYAQRIS